MKHPIILSILKICGEVLLLTLVVGLLVGLVGLLSRWDTPRAYSNAFFIAGALVFVGGAASRLGAAQEWTTSVLIHPETFRDLTGAERTGRIMETASSFRLVILGLLSGILLCLISEFVAILF